jgi:flagellar basal-body rod protein FlgF
MDRMLYLAMSGAKQTMLAQTAVSHNLANANTVGFRADLEAFRSMPVFGPGHPSRVFAMSERPDVDFSAGTVISTGNNLDVAIKGDGWLAVEAEDGSEAYTRAGDLRIGSNGILETGAGHPVLGNGGPIAIPPHETLEIGTDGTISILPLGQDPNTLADIDRLKLVNPDIKQLVKGDDGLFRLEDGTQAPADASVNLVRGSLESSNVNTVHAMVEMISLARQFEMQIKAMRTVEENEQQTAQLMRLS